MGVLYTVLCPDEGVRQWLQSEGLTCPESPSRWPTGEEIKHAIERFSGFTVEYTENGLGHPWQAFLTDVESGGENAYALMNIDNYHGPDAPNEFWFEKGSTELNVAILLALSARTGPMVLLADAGGPPLIVSLQHQLITPADEWIDETSTTWTRLVREAST